VAPDKPDPEILRRKVQFIRDALRQLEEIRSEGEVAFAASSISQAAAVRNLQVAVEAVLDTANHIIAREGLGIPRAYKDAVDLLIQNGILPRDKADDFAAMIRFRNRAVHLYDTIESEEIWKILVGHLGDFEIFLQAIVERYLAPGAP
jgi:uncharacterized protein YutE (UPF0331/DUF86 family)